ncbi:unnamed protein product [Pieris macdunnoughi]|uniref:Uncharacterized protein n=1 Tax=Pieris macdunnoughi TaxID=345717 RepID=A0A821Y4P1_9NEOP|nr:unnamed protein product [Pieris macdunnoughi]
MDLVLNRIFIALGTWTETFTCVGQFRATEHFMGVYQCRVELLTAEIARIRSTMENWIKELDIPSTVWKADVRRACAWMVWKLSEPNRSTKAVAKMS